MSKTVAQSDASFMEWLGDLVKEHPESVRAEKEEALSLHLAEALKTARAAAGMTQAMVSEGSGLKQSVVSRLEKASHNSTLQSIVRYLDALGADLVLSVVLGGRSFPATELAERTVTLPEHVMDSAETRGLSPREYVLSCLDASHALENLGEVIQDSIQREMGRHFSDMRQWIRDSSSGERNQEVGRGHLAERYQFRSSSLDEHDAFMAAA